MLPNANSFISTFYLKKLQVLHPDVNQQNVSRGQYYTNEIVLQNLESQREAVMQH